MSPAIATILVGADGLPASQAALRWTGGLAVACQANVHAVYAWWSHQSELSPPIAAREKRQAVAVVPASIEMFPAGPVIVGVDGSDASLVAVLWAAGLATEVRRTLLAVHALGDVETFGVEGWPQPDVGRIEAHLNLVREEHGPIPLEIVPDLPGSALDELADRHHAAAVVVGGLRRGLLADLRLGRTPVQLLQRGSGPVVIVPDR
jgi:nucleotide-binding universal stress UspA family protein